MMASNKCAAVQNQAIVVKLIDSVKKCSSDILEKQEKVSSTEKDHLQHTFNSTFQGLVEKNVRVNGCLLKDLNNEDAETCNELRLDYYFKRIIPDAESMVVQTTRKRKKSRKKCTEYFRKRFKQDIKTLVSQQVCLKPTDPIPLPKLEADALSKNVLADFENTKLAISELKTQVNILCQPEL